MNHRLYLAFAVVAFLAAVTLCSPAPAQQSLRGREFTDKTNGYRVTIPVKWLRMPTNVDEKWIISHFQSKKEYVGSAKAGDSLMGHKPYMKVIIFDDEVIRKFVETEKDGGTTIKRLKHPYRNYKDYVKRNLSGGGYYFSQEDPGESKGIKVMKYQIKLEKLTRDKKRFVAWVFAAQGVKFAVEFEVLESQYNKVASMIMTSLKSFKFIERTGVTVKEDAILKKSYSKEDWRKLPAKKRLEIRKEIDKAREKKMLDRLPQGWTATKTKHFLVISHSSKKFTKRIADAAEIFRSWLNKRFGKITDEYAMKSVIRICKNSDEYRSYYSASSETRWNFRNREFVTYNDYTNVGLNSGRMFWQIYGYFMQDKAPELLFNAPIWVDSGLDMFIADAILKSGKKLVFQRSIEEFTDFAELRKMPEGFIKTAKEIMNLDSIGLTGDKRNDAELRRQHLGSQVATFFRFMEGPGKRVKFLKKQDYLMDYMRAVLLVAKDFDKRGGIRIGGMKEATTEEEEEAQSANSAKRWKQYMKQARARRAEFLVELKKKMPPWTDEQFATLEKAYVAYHSKKTR